VHRCEVETQDGRRCGRYVATILYDGLWRCPSHRPRNKPQGPPDETAPASAPPVKALRKPADALALASWAALEMAAGHISPQRCAQTVAACKEYRIAWAQEDRNRTELEVIATWYKALDADAAGDRVAYAEHMAALRPLLVALGIKFEPYEVPARLPALRGPDGLLPDEDA